MNPGSGGRPGRFRAVLGHSFTVRAAEGYSPFMAEREGSAREDLTRLKDGAAVALRASGLDKGVKGKKSLLLSGALSFFFGPWGWLYSGAWVEAIPAVVVYSLAVYILPSFVLFYLLALVNLGSAACGVLYAWGYNRDGKRLRLTGKDAAEKKLGKGERPAPKLGK